MPASRPIVLACSGCSHAGQLANRVALELDRRGVAEMSCLAGVGAMKPHFLKQIACRELWIVDGCPVECSLGILQNVHQRADVHIRLHDMGVRKHDPGPDGADFEQLMQRILDIVANPSPTRHSE